MNREYYVLNSGRFKRKENTIYFVDSTESSRALPIEQIDSLHIFGEVDLNTKFLTIYQNTLYYCISTIITVFIQVRFIQGKRIFPVY